MLAALVVCDDIFAEELRCIARIEANGRAACRLLAIADAPAGCRAHVLAASDNLILAFSPSYSPEPKVIEHLKERYVAQHPEPPGRVLGIDEEPSVPSSFRRCRARAGA